MRIGFWAVGGVLLIATGIVLLLNVKGTASALWRFWESCWRGDGQRAYGNPLFIRLWFGVLCVVIGAGWIYAGS